MKRTEQVTGKLTEQTTTITSTSTSATTTTKKKKRKEYLKDITDIAAFLLPFLSHSLPAGTSVYYYYYYYFFFFLACARADNGNVSSMVERAHTSSGLQLLLRWPSQSQQQQRKHERKRKKEKKKRVYALLKTERNKRARQCILKGARTSFGELEKRERSVKNMSCCGSILRFCCLQHTHIKKKKAYRNKDRGFQSPDPKTNKSTGIK